MKYFVKKEDTVVELTSQDWFLLMGTNETRMYVEAVYKNTMTLEEVPEELRQSVVESVEKRKEWFGIYEDQTISNTELRKMLEEVL